MAVAVAVARQVALEASFMVHKPTVNGNFRPSLASWEHKMVKLGSRQTQNLTYC